MKSPSTIKVKFTNKPPTKSGLYLTPSGDFIQAVYIKEIREWSISDYPRAQVSSPWDEKTDKRSTVRFDF